MHIHILGICGTFMGSLAQLAKAMGHQVSGSDQNVYPPMSDQLEQAGITLQSGYEYALDDYQPDLVIVGNAMSRGKAIVEQLLNSPFPYTSGPQWLGEQVLRNKKSIVICGTHGKTTTSSLCAWILEYAGLNPSFLIGGVPQNFGVSARLTDSEFFVIEGDEYDTAFFDKRSKFLHYAPNIALINNMEFDHADIFDNLAAIQKQFHHMVRLIPSEGSLLHSANTDSIEQTLAMGCWSPCQSISATGEQASWSAKLVQADGSEFKVFHQGQPIGQVHWPLLGEHNVQNALGAIACAVAAGVKPSIALEALPKFAGPKRRLEVLVDNTKVTLYDDFAHHPSAVRTTLEALKAQPQPGRIICLIEPRSNTMKMGVHQSALFEALDLADEIGYYQAPELSWQPPAEFAQLPKVHVFNQVDQLAQHTINTRQPGDRIVMMSNGSFGGLATILKDALT